MQIIKGIKKQVMLKVQIFIKFKFQNNLLDKILKNYIVLFRKKILGIFFRRYIIRRVGNIRRAFTVLGRSLRNLSRIFPGRCAARVFWRCRGAQFPTKIGLTCRDWRGICFSTAIILSFPGLPSWYWVCGSVGRI